VTNATMAVISGRDIQSAVTAEIRRRCSALVRFGDRFLDRLFPDLRVRSAADEKVSFATEANSVSKFPAREVLESAQGYSP
jgi:hypothetical protein